jgi:hypothetical protein
MLVLLAALFSLTLCHARPSLCTLEALRGTVGGATMTTPGGAGTRLRIEFLKLTRARRTGFYHRVGAPRLQGSGPSFCPGPTPSGQPALPFAEWGSVRLALPLLPSLRLSKHTPTPSVKQSSIWSTKKSPIWDLGYMLRPASVVQSDYR